MAELCLVFSQYARKVARVRDKGDEIAQTLSTKAEIEGVNKSLSMGLLNFASALANISDYGDMRVKNIDTKVINQLSQYEDVCKRTRDDVKLGFSVRERELQRKKQYDRLRDRNPRNRQQIVRNLQYSLLERVYIFLL